MAKAKKVKEVVAEIINDVASATINEELLTTLVAETRKNGFINITHIDLALLEAEGYVEVNKNSETTNANGYAWRATEKGINFIMGAPKTEKKIAVKHVFNIAEFNPENVVAKATSGKRGRTSKYDFDALVNVNTYMFVPASEKYPNPAASLVATVTAQNMKHAVPTGEMRTVSRKPKGGTEKVSKEVPVMEFVKEFKVVAYTENGVSGAAIVRIK